MEWNDENIARLRELWAEGHSTAEIGRRMGISKNAVVGKAHRLSLPPRPSPIRREEVEAKTPPAPRRVTGPTLPPLVQTPRTERAPDLPAPRPTPTLRPVSAPSSARRANCCWPVGEPGTPAFHFCDADAVHGRPYCAEHVQLAYVRVRDRREDVA